MTNNNWKWKKNFKRKKKCQYGKRKQKNSTTYQRFQEATVPSDAVPGDQPASDAVGVNPVPIPNSKVFAGPPVPILTLLSSKEPPAPLFLINAHPLWQAYSCIRASNPMSGRLSLYRASRLYVKYVLHVPDPPFDYCYGLEEVHFLNTLQEIEMIQQSGECITEDKRQQLLERWEKDLPPLQENYDDSTSPTITAQVSPAPLTVIPQAINTFASPVITTQEGSPLNDTSATNISPSAALPTTALYEVKKRDRAIRNYEAKLQKTETKLVKALAAKEKAVALLDQVRTSRNKQREKTEAAEELLKSTKSKNKALTQQLKTATTKSIETNHRLWLDKKENLNLLEETKKAHKAELKEQQDTAEQRLQDQHTLFEHKLETHKAKLKEQQEEAEHELEIHRAKLKEQEQEAQQMLQDERTRFQDQLEIQENKLLAETLLRSYLKRKYEKQQTKAVNAEVQKKEKKHKQECDLLHAEIAAKTKELSTKEKEHEHECNVLEAKIVAKSNELHLSQQHNLELKTQHRSTNSLANEKQKKMQDEKVLMEYLISEMALEVKQSKCKVKLKQKKAKLANA